MRVAAHRNTSGAIAVEFALLLPLMLLLMLGAFTTTRLARASMKMWTIADSIGDLVAQQTSLSTAQMSDFCSGASLMLTPFTGSIQATVASVTNNVSGTATTRTVDWQDTTCGNGNAITNAVAIGTAYTSNPQDSVIIVRVTYAYAFPASYYLPKTFTLTRTTFTRPRSGVQVARG